MELTVFVRKSNDPKANSIKTVKSLRHELVQLKDIIFIDNFENMPYGMIQSEWWIVLYDNEMVEEQLLEGIIAGSRVLKYDAFSCYKKELVDEKLKVTICPRVFRRGIKLDGINLCPNFPISMETLLDGWIMSIGTEND